MTPGNSVKIIEQLDLKPSPNILAHETIPVSLQWCQRCKWVNGSRNNLAFRFHDGLRLSPISRVMNWAFAYLEEATTAR